MNDITHLELEYEAALYGNNGMTTDEVPFAIRSATFASPLFSDLFFRVGSVAPCVSADLLRCRIQFSLILAEHSARILCAALSSVRRVHTLPVLSLA